jgi:hypothetical protein
MLYHYGSTSISNTINNVTYNDGCTMFLNATEACHLKIPKKLHAEDLV